MIQKRLVEILCLVLAVFSTALNTALTADETSSDGTFFVVAFPVTKLDSRSGRNQLIITTKVESTSVTVSQSEADSTTYAVGVDAPLRVTIGDGRRTVDGRENKGIEITSLDDVSVKVLVEDIDAYGDIGLAQPVRDDSVEFYLNVPHVNAVGDCGTEADRTFSFVVVVASQEDTRVNISDAAGLVVASFTINRYQTYTHRQVQVERNVGLDGYRVVPTKPVTVISGNACFVSGVATYASPIFDFVPPVARLGRNHVVPVVNSPRSAAQDQYVQVVAVATTQLRITGQANAIVLQRSQSFIAAYDAFDPVVVLCDQPCVVTQTTYNYGPTFMVHVPHTGVYNRDVVLAFPTESGGTGFTRSLSIIYPFSQVEQVFLNDNSLKDLAWVCGNDPLLYYCMTEFLIDVGLYHLKAVSDQGVLRNLTAVLTSTLTDNGDGIIYEGKGYGFMAGFNSVYYEPPPAPNPNTTTSQNQPFYTITHAASFNTDQPIAIGCDASYRLALTARVRQMEDLVNILVQNGTICQAPYLFGPVGLLNTTGVSVSAPTGSTSGSHNFTWHVQGASSLSISHIESCGSDVNSYLASFANWDNNIMPPVDGCPDVTYQQNEFTPLDASWNCDASDLKSRVNPDQPVTLTDDLRFELILSGLFSTDDGADIDTTCAQQYSLAFDDSAFQASLSAGDMLAAGTLCSGRFVEIQSSSASINVNENLGSTRHSVIFNPSGSLPFYEIQNCVEEVSNYMEDSSNWPNPIIPDIVGCPEVSFDQAFIEFERNWLCVSTVPDSEMSHEENEYKLRPHRINSRPVKKKTVFTQPSIFLDHVKRKISVKELLQKEKQKTQGRSVHSHPIRIRQETLKQPIRTQKKLTNQINVNKSFVPRPMKS